MGKRKNEYLQSCNGVLTYSDEAHRLYRYKNLPGVRLYAKFDRVNKELIGRNFTDMEGPDLIKSHKVSLPQKTHRM